MHLCQIWCVGSGADNQTRYYINKTVDGNTLSTVLKGLMPVLYQVEVAAVTRAGVGTHSQPVSILISECTDTGIILRQAPFISLDQGWAIVLPDGPGFRSW